MLKVVFCLMAACIVATFSCSAADLDSVDYYELDSVQLSPMTASALDYGVALAAADWSTTDSANLADIRNALTTLTSGTLLRLVYDMNADVETIKTTDNTINTTLNTLKTTLNTIAGYLDGVSSNNLADDVYWIRRGISDLSSDLVAIRGDTDSIVTYITSIDTSVSSIGSLVSSLNTNFSNWFSEYRIYHAREQGSFVYWINWSNFVSDIYGELTGGYSSRYSTPSIRANINRLATVLASDDDVALANSQKANREEIESEFLTGSSGSTSLGVSDFGDLADVGGTIKDSLSLDGNATIGSFTSGLAAADSAGQGWFSEETRSQLDAVSSTVTYSLRDPDPYNMVGWEDRYYWLLGDD